MNEQETQALAILTGVPYAYYQGQAYVQADGGPRNGFRPCAGCFFTSDGSPQGTECAAFRTGRETKLFGTPKQGMCDLSFSRYGRPIWILAT